MRKALANRKTSRGEGDGEHGRRYREKNLTATRT
jgi:hypothetical protein